MTDAKKEARKIKAQIHKHGVVAVVRDDSGKCHCIPGHDVDLIAIYREPVSQSYIESDLTPEAP